MADGLPDIETIFIFGGAQIYSQVLQERIPDQLLISNVPGRHGCDRFLEPIPACYAVVSSETVTYDGTPVRHDTFELDRTG